MVVPQLPHIRGALRSDSVVTDMVLCDGEVSRGPTALSFSQQRGSFRDVPESAQDDGVDLLLQAVRRRSGGGRGVKLLPLPDIDELTTFEELPELSDEDESADESPSHGRRAFAKPSEEGCAAAIQFSVPSRASRYAALMERKSEAGGGGFRRFISEPGEHFHLELQSLGRETPEQQLVLEEEAPKEASTEAAPAAPAQPALPRPAALRSFRRASTAHAVLQQVAVDLQAVGSSAHKNLDVEHLEKVMKAQPTQE